jgi:hypothetical protein
MPNQPMMEKLLAMRLQGMVEALKTQEQDRAINELTFLERLALLVDQQWSWRENQALYSALYLRTAALLRELALTRADGSLRHFMARLGHIDVLVIDDRAMAPLNENERREVWEDLRRSLPDPFHGPYFPTAGLALARADRRSHHRRWHPRPSGAQPPPHRDARRVHAQETQSAAGGEEGMNQS